jgi:hypothetical protein
MGEQGKSPRHYAYAYLSAGEDKEKQRQAVSGCPVAWRELVKTHIRIIKQRRDKNERD